MSTELPVIGAAMKIAELERNHNWVMESQRDLELQDFVDAEVLDGDWRPLAKRTRELLDGYTGRMGIHGPFRSLPMAARDPAIRAVVSRRIGQGLDICEAIGATHMVIHSPFTTWDHNNLTKDPHGLDRLTEYCHLTLRDAVRRAEAIGCTLVIENIEDKDPTARVHLAQSFESSAVAVSIDTGHAHYAHGYTGAPPVDYFVIAAGKHLAHVHLQDADGYADRHWAPGQGTIHWHAVFAALRRTNSNPRLILELADASRIQSAAGWLAEHGLGR
ncbi:MAG TPA: sugar phosphate isomerase/epimerase family protein [Arsenicitalea sp.]|jgi:sugar phosphate isomerase/epimerase|nr:sugar phosphate isomerase/epimerase family protein [Arsenicitalea sp.]